MILDFNHFADLNKTGYSDVLNEMSRRPAIYETWTGTPSAIISISKIIDISGVPDVRYLSVEEQRVLDRALRRSVRLVHKATDA